MSSTLLRYALAAIATGLIPGVAAAGFYSGDTLYEACSAAPGNNAYFEKSYECVGYVSGAVDAFNTTREANRLKSCIPAGVTINRLRQVTVAYLRDHPAERTQSASTLVFAATRKAWPCPKRAVTSSRKTRKKQR